MSDFTIRPMRKEDEPFIYRAWLEGYWPHFPGNVIVSKSEYLERWHGVIERILADPHTVTVVAHVEGEPDVLLGFACGNDACLHWAYVKQAFRHLGIAHECINGMGKSFSDERVLYSSHWTGFGSDIEYYPELLKEYGT